MTKEQGCVALILLPLGVNLLAFTAILLYMVLFVPIGDEWLPERVACVVTLMAGFGLFCVWLGLSHLAQRGS